MANVLFVCVQNAGRSQMAEALFERAADGRHQARSAGTRPAGHVHHEVADAMAELGLDIAHHRPRKLTHDESEWAEVIVTMGCGDECPYIPGKRYIDWDLADPAGRPAAEVRAIRDEIVRRTAELIREFDEADEPAAR